MKRVLNIRCSNNRVNGNVLTCESVSIREKLLRILFGSPVRFVVLLPGKSVDCVEIHEISEGADHE